LERSFNAEGNLSCIGYVRPIRRLLLGVVCVCGSCCSTLFSESLHKCVAIASLPDNVSKWKKEGGRGGLCVLGDSCDGDECHVNATVVTAIRSLSGEEERLRKDNQDLGMVKLRGQITCDK